MQFSDILGQERIKEQLRAMVASGRFPHALLLLGPPGSGGLSLALAAAQYLQCENRGAEEACGRCPHCVKAARYIHPDIHFSFPVTGSKAVSSQYLEAWRSMLRQSTYFSWNDWMQHLGVENQQGNITKDECVNIVRTLSLKTFEGVYKILIMWLPEYLGKEGNRLLKLIEEPPEQTVFLLVAENQDLILNTILSRCQLLKITSLPDAAIVAGLQREKGIPEDQARHIAALADGDFSEALKMAVNMERDYAKSFLEWMRLCYLGNREKEPIVRWVEAAAGWGRENQKHFLRYALHFTEQILRCKAMATEKGLRLADEEKITAERMSKVLDYDMIDQLVALLNDGIFAVERNANPKVLFLDMSIGIKNIIRGQTSDIRQ